MRGNAGNEMRDPRLSRLTVTDDDGATPSACDGPRLRWHTGVWCIRSFHECQRKTRNNDSCDYKDTQCQRNHTPSSYPCNKGNKGSEEHEPTKRLPPSHSAFFALLAAATTAFSLVDPVSSPRTAVETAFHSFLRPSLYQLPSVPSHPAKHVHVISSPYLRPVNSKTDSKADLSAVAAFLLQSHGNVAITYKNASYGLIFAFRPDLHQAGIGARGFMRPDHAHPRQAVLVATAIQRFAVFGLGRSFRQQSCDGKRPP